MRKAPPWSYCLMILLLPAFCFVDTDCAIAAHEKAPRRECEKKENLRERAEILSYLADKNVAHGEFSKALDYAEDGLELAKADDAPEINMRLRFALGVALQNLGHPGKAASQFSQALALAKQIDHDEGIWKSGARLGDLYVQMGDIPRSVTHFEEAAGAIEKLQEDSGGAAPTSTLPTEFSDRLVRACIVAVRPKRWETPLPEQLRVFNSLTSGLLSTNEPEKALHSILRRNRWLAGLNVPAEGASFDSPKRQQFYTDYQTLEEGAESPAPPGHRSLDWLIGRKVTQETLLRRIREEERLLYDWMVPQSTDVAAFQQSLPRDTGVIVYFMTEDAVWAFTLTSDSLQNKRLSVEPESLRSEIQSLRYAVAAAKPRGEFLQDYHSQAARRLYEQLISPLPTELANRETWYIVPDDFLWTLPFPALTHDTPEGVRYLNRRPHRHHGKYSQGTEASPFRVHPVPVSLRGLCKPPRQPPCSEDEAEVSGASTLMQRFAWRRGHRVGPAGGREGRGRAGHFFTRPQAAHG